MPRYIDLQRRFHDLTKAELENPELLALLSDREFGLPTCWADLLKYGRVLLIAEAGAGKTIEMREQAKRLVMEGKFAFFIPLESLDRVPFLNLLSTAEDKLFDAWKADGHAPVWFFLDAVDELKLTEGKLDRALLGFSKAIDGHLDRTRVIISSRPNDWRADLDMATLNSRLPLPEKHPAEIPPPDELFMQTLRREHAEPVKGQRKEQDDPAKAIAVRTVILLPLGKRQIRLFIERSGVRDASALVAEIRRQDAWTFARRPLDLSELISTWTSSGRLGTRAEQHKANIAAKLKDDPNRPDRGVLTDAQAWLGAERLALALALTRTRTIRSPEQVLDVERSEGVLDPTTILRDWTEDARQALLRRSLFDPATYGRVRFHHRSVQEFLAARHLKLLREKGMSTRALFRLLFAERYGEEVVIPSMRAIAAWLALWDNAVLQELTRREPETLLSLGDPESLSLTARAKLVRAFTNAYRDGGWRGFDIPLDEMRRVAHPELASVIRELWGNGPTNPDVRELLVRLIWLGPIEGCVDLAQAAAVNVSYNSYDRIAAVRALIACGRDASVREIADAMLADPASWPDKTVHGLAADLFPKIISVDELLTLMERTREPQQTTSGFGWVARQIAESIEPASALAMELRDKMAELIWSGRTAEHEFYSLRSRFDHLAPALAMLCERQLAVVIGTADAGLIRACVIASRFATAQSGSVEQCDKIRARLREHGSLREAVFKTEVALMDEAVPTKDDWHRLYNAQYDSLIGRLTEADRPWLEAMLPVESGVNWRPVALHALLQLWKQRGSVPEEVDIMRTVLREDPTLERILTERTTPPRQDAEAERVEQEHRRWQCEYEDREAQRLQGWDKWRKELVSHSDQAFDAEKLQDTLANLYAWLDASQPSRNSYNVWSRELLKQAFGDEVARRASDAFKGHWRSNPPILWSARSPEERNRTPFAWLYGLCGLFAECATPGWETHLTSNEARVAAAYATVEMNGLASFISDLTASHPREVDEVLGRELSEQLKAGDHDHLPILEDLTHAVATLKQLLAPRLFAALLKWPTTITAETGARWAHHLDQVLGILAETGIEADCGTIAQVCAQRYKSDPTGSLGLVWLRGLFRFDPHQGTKELTAVLAAAGKAATKARAVEVFASLFGESGSLFFGTNNSVDRARSLGSLVRSANAFIRHDDDQVHEGPYSPDTRDHAQRARSLLLSALLETPGPEARREILELTTEPDFAHFPDRLRLLARQRAAADAEFPAFDSEGVANLESLYEAPPCDRDGLFRVVMDRLEDLAHDLTNDDFTNRRTLATISDEIEMQRTLASRIKSEARGAFVVTREDEVADRKRTDIRLTAVRGDQRAVIEVKLADDRYSLAQLESALYNQLVRQYLRHETCKAGVLLLTYNGHRNSWQHPISNDDLKFADLVDYLNKKARQLEIDNQYTICVGVFGIDLTDPPIPSTRRGH